MNLMMVPFASKVVVPMASVFRIAVSVILIIMMIMAALLSYGCSSRTSGGAVNAGNRGTAPGATGVTPRNQGAAPGPNLHGLQYNPPLPAPDFALKDQHGQVFRLSDQRGRAVLLFFGYTACPDVCPATLTSLKRVHEQLGPGADIVRFVFVTVDPERDTAERVGNFIRAVGHEDFIGLSGTREELEKVWKAYSIYVQKEDAPGSKAGYFVNHTASTFLITSDGKLRTVYQFGTDPRVIASDLRQVLGLR